MSEAAPIAAWVGADRAARAAARRIDRAVNAAGLYAVRSACQSTAPVNTDRGTTLDAVTGNALRAHARAAGGIAPRSWPAMRSTHGVIWPGWTPLTISIPQRSRAPCNEYGCWRKTPGGVSRAPGAVDPERIR